MKNRKNAVSFKKNYEYPVQFLDRIIMNSSRPEKLDLFRAQWTKKKKKFVLQMKNDFFFFFYFKVYENPAKLRYSSQVFRPANSTDMLERYR